MTKKSIVASTAHGVDPNNAYVGLLGGYDPSSGYYDFRVGLFISILRREANDNKGDNEAYRLSAVEDTTKISAIRKVFGSPRLPDYQESQSTYGTHGDALTTKFRTGHLSFLKVPDVLRKGNPLRQAFFTFLCDLVNRLDTKNTNDIFGSVKFITEYVPSLNTPENQGEYRFAIAVVQTFLSQITNRTGESIIDSPNRWKEATGGIYHTKSIIINNLFPTPKIKSTVRRVHTDSKYYAHGGAGEERIEEIKVLIIRKLTDFNTYFKSLNEAYITNRDNILTELIGPELKNHLRHICDEIIVFMTELSRILYSRKFTDMAKEPSVNFMRLIPAQIISMFKGILVLLNDKDYNTKHTIRETLMEKIDAYLKHIAPILHRLGASSVEPPAPRMELDTTIMSDDMGLALSRSKRDELLIINETLNKCDDSPSGDTHFDTDDINEFIQKLSEMVHKRAQKAVDDILKDKTVVDPDIESGATPIDLIRNKMGLSGEDNSTQYYRESENPDILYIKRPGKQAVDARETADAKANQTGHCQSGLMGKYDNDTACTEFFFTCLAGGDVSGCKRFLADPDFWTTGSTNFLKNINLYKASEAFIKYDIPLENVDGHAQFKDTAAWITHLRHIATENPRIIDDAHITAIAHNTAFLQLIDATIKLINATPTILNKSVTKSRPVTVTPPPNPTSGLIANPIRNGGSHFLHTTNLMGLTRYNLAKSSESTTNTFNSIQAKLNKLQQDLLAMSGRRHPGVVLYGPPPFYAKYASTGGATIPDNIQSTDAVHNILDNFNLNEFFSEEMTDMRQLMTNISDIKMTEPESLHELLKSLITFLEKDGLTVDKNDISIVESAMEGLKAYRKTILTIILFIYFKILFFHSTVGPAILSTGLESGNPTNDKKLRDLFSSQKMDLKKLSEMVKIGRAKLEKYCSKGDKHGQICDKLITESFKYIK